MKSTVKTFLSDVTWQGLVLSSFCKHWQNYGLSPNVMLNLTLAQYTDLAMQRYGNIVTNSSAILSQERFENFDKATSNAHRISP